MKVILKQDVRNVGKAGQVVSVSDGYGRNYLIPRGLAVPATDSNVRALAYEQKVAGERKAREQEEAQRLAARLEGASVQIRAKTGESGRLFGSVTAGDIVEALQQQLRVEVDKRKVELEEPIKNLGAHPVTLRLYPGISAVVTVQVVPEG